MKIKTLLFIISNIFLITFSFAQLTPTAAILKTTPSIVSSNQDFEIYLESFSFNVDKANYIWKVNGKELARGQGIRSIKLKTGTGGNVLNVTASVTTIEGYKINVSKSINPGEISLIWESIDGYTPNWYEGKTLNTYGGIIKVTAFTNIIENNKYVNSKDLVYRWFVNENLQNDYSGLGRDTLIYKGIEEELDKVTVRVEIETQNNNYVYGKSLKIPFVDGEVNIYSKDNKLGILNNFALSNVISFVSKDINLVAEPFYFSSKNKNSLNYSWEINNQTSFGASNAERFIKIPDNKTGLSKINLKVVNKSKLLQEASSGFSIKF